LEGVAVNRRFVAALVVALTVCGLVAADEFQAVITKVKDGRITYKRVKGRNEEGKTEYDSEKALPFAKDVKVVKARYDTEARKMVNGDPLEGGLKHDAFKDLGKNKDVDGVLATLITDTDNKKISQIRVLILQHKKKYQFKTKDKDGK
jgi:hypothetical protein